MTVGSSCRVVIRQRHHPVTYGFYKKPNRPLQSGGSVADGPAIADGVVYLGSGYAQIKLGKPNNMVFAFAPTR